MSSSTEGVDDMISLTKLNEEAILENLKVRYDKDVIYVCTPLFYFLLCLFVCFVSVFAYVCGARVQTSCHCGNAVFVLGAVVFRAYTMFNVCAHEGNDILLLASVVVRFDRRASNTP